MSEGDALKNFEGAMFEGTMYEGAMLEWALTGASGLREMPQAAPDDAALVAYLVGAVTVAEAAGIERGLVAHPAARRRLGQVAQRVDVLRAQAWPAPVADEAGQMDAVAAAWKRLVETGLASPAAARRSWLAGGWDGIRAGLASSLPDVRPAWTAFENFAGQWQRARSAPQWAAARGAAVSPLPLPEGVALWMEAAVTAEGNLTARAWVRDAAGQSSSVLDGRPVWLSLALEGDAWPLADAGVREGVAEWCLVGLGRLLRLSAGPLPAEDLMVSLAPPAVPGAEAVRPRVAVSGKGQEARIELWGQPQISDGWLRLSVALPALTRSMFADQALCLTLTVSSETHQWLGSWRVAEWGDSDLPRLLEVTCPGATGEFDATRLCFDLVAASP